MKVFREKHLNGVLAIEAGWSPIGTPFMSVHFYLADGVLLDTGQSLMRRPILGALRGRDLEAVLLTHHHEDHSGNAAAVGREFGLEVYGGPGTREKMSRPFRIMPYQYCMWGRSEPASVNVLEKPLTCNELTFQHIPTPGHSPDHTAYLVKERGWLFSGDLYLADRIKFFRADERIGDEIASLRKVLSLDFDTLFCSHNPKLKRGKARIAAKLSFLEDIYGAVSELHDRGLDEKEIMRKIHLGEVHFIRWLTAGNVSARNIVRSVIESHRSVLRGIPK